MEKSTILLSAANGHLTMVSVQLTNRGGGTLVADGRR